MVADPGSYQTGSLVSSYITAYGIFEFNFEVDQSFLRLNMLLPSSSMQHFPVTQSKISSKVQISYLSTQFLIQAQFFQIS